MPKKVATAHQTARRIPENLLHGPENWIQDWPEFRKIWPEKFPKKNLKFARNFRSYIYSGLNA